MNEKEGIKVKRVADKMLIKIRLELKLSFICFLKVIKNCVLSYLEVNGIREIYLDKK